MRRPDHLSAGAALSDVVLAVALTLGAGVIAGVLAPGLMRHFDLPLLTVLMLQGVIILIGLRILLSRRGDGWTGIGLSLPVPADLLRAALALVLVYLVNISFMSLILLLFPEVVEGHQERLFGVAMSLTADVSLVVIALAMLFTGFYEEVLARGFLLSRCRRLMGGVWGPVLVSSLLFGLGHAYQGWAGVVQTALIGVVFARLALHWGRLWPLIIAHGALNTVSLVVMRAAA
ncbi:MAG: CPBP family intramembrane metalloprotease [Ectothiorhodospiraceae bacterium]|nr:CPBP family intramembrane metalloprotease [Ectothiorhodospiraceae bacterium]